MFIATHHFHESATMLTPEPFISLLSTCSVEHAPHGHVPDTSSQSMTWSVHKPPSLELRLVQRKGYRVKFSATYVALRVGAHTFHQFDTSPTPSIAQHVDLSTTIILCRLRFSQRSRLFKTDPAGNLNVGESLRNTFCPVFATASPEESPFELSLSDAFKM